MTWKAVAAPADPAAVVDATAAAAADQPSYSVTSAIHPESCEHRFVVIDVDGRLHPPGTAWRPYLADIGHSPHTVREYRRRGYPRVSGLAVVHECVTHVYRAPTE